MGAAAPATPPPPPQTTAEGERLIAMLDAFLPALAQAVADDPRRAQAVADVRKRVDADLIPRVRVNEFPTDVVNQLIELIEALQGGDVARAATITNAVFSRVGSKVMLGFR